MGYQGTQFRMPLVDTGLRGDRNVELLPPTALLPPSCNVNYHQNGLGKRGGSQIVIPGQGNSGQGIFQFQQPAKSTLVFASNGNIYQTNYGNILASGLSASNPICFIQTSNYIFYADGQSIPRYWSGSGADAAVTPSASWTGNMPFQMVNHTRAGSGAGDRLWAVTPDSVWYSDINNPTQFSTGSAGQIPIDSIGGLTGAIDLGGQLFAFSRTQTFLIQDTDTTLTEWGYTNAIWEGGVANWRLIKNAFNNTFLMAEDGLIYNLQGIVATGSYMSAALDRPAFIDQYIRSNINLGNVQNFHIAYDRTLRALKFFMQSGGQHNNMSMVYFIDKQPTSAWIIHNNPQSSSGYNATCSCEVRVSAGNYQVYTMDTTGNIWALEQTSRDDNGNPYPTIILTKAQDLNIPRNNKHFMALCLRGQASGEVDWTLNSFVEGAAQPAVTFSINGTGATFDSSTFDNAQFGADEVTSAPEYLGYFGRDLQIQLTNNMVGQDFFLSEILFMTKPLGLKVTF